MKILSTFISLLIISNTLFAADLAVREGGAGGAYDNISDAITAAASGDRIIIKPKAGGASYQESLTITKSLQFICEDEGDQFYVDGTVTISPSVALEVAFVGFKLLGTFGTTINAPSTARTVVKVLNGDLTGDILFAYNNYDLTIANSTIVGEVAFRAGRLIGNTITNTASNEHAIDITDETTSLAPILSDTILITGNRITHNSSSSSYSAIYCYTYDYYYHIHNNFIQYDYKGIYIYRWNGLNGAENLIVNNTLYELYSANTTNYAIYLYNAGANDILKVYNNLFDGRSTVYSDYGIYGSLMTTAMVNVGYNVFDSNFDGASYYITGVTDDGTNLTASSFTYDASTGKALSGTAINGGHIDSVYYDIDLTLNDVGTYGGSYTQQNYWPTSDVNTKIYMLDIPKRVIVGNAIRVQAEGYDK